MTSRLNIYITSFSYKKGVPVSTSPHGGGFVFDCRSVTNPGREERYKLKTGRDADVQAFIDATPEGPAFFRDILSLVDRSVSVYLKRGFDTLEISLGCTGGQHRSVYFSEKLAAHLSKNPDLVVHLKHRELGLP